LLKIDEDDNQLEASWAEPPNFEDTDESERENPPPRIEIITAPLVGKLLQL